MAALMTAVALTVFVKELPALRRYLRMRRM